MSSERQLRRVEDAFFVELEPSFCYSFQHLLQVLSVFALRLAKNDYVIHVA